MYCWPSVCHYIHRYLVLILMDQSLFSFQGGGGSEDFGVITWFSGGKEGNHSPTDRGGGGGGLDKIECQLTANEMVS